MHIRSREHERGAVSIFIVIFFALLIGVITVSFVSIVIRGTTQAANNDLSRSAYDSAQAGVEDAKRAIALYTNECNSGGSACGSYTTSINKDNCTTMLDFAGPLKMTNRVDGGAITLQNQADNNFKQAYTCVNITMDTPDYVGSQPDYQSDLIPLNSTSNFNRVKLSWYTHSDGNLPDTTAFQGRPGGSNNLPPESGWGTDITPSLLRVELIAYDGSVNDATLQANSRTLFLYPSQAGSGGVISFDANSKQPPSSTNPSPLVAVHCGGTGTYACNATLSLDSNAGKANAFLRVTPVYKAKTTFAVNLQQNNTPVLFNGVQPMVDSTGRAGDLFRRVQARVRIQNSVTYPEFAVESYNQFCKNFSVGSSPDDYKYNCS